MKKNLTLLFAILTTSGLFSQSATSIASGNWTNPMTWNCTCVPTPGYNVTINHSVTLSMDWAYSSGSILINASGKLQDDATGRNMWIYGTGTFVNNGTFDIKKMLYQGTAAAFSNTDTMYVQTFMNTTSLNNSGVMMPVDSFYNNGTMVNSGTIDVMTFYTDIDFTNSGKLINVDSLANSGIFLNTSTGLIIADSAQNFQDFTNDGRLLFQQFTNSGNFINNNFISFEDFTNEVDFWNNDSLIGSNSAWNQGNFYNVAGAHFNIGNGFLNHEPNFGTAVFDNEGWMKVFDSWYNFDTVKGNAGSITVQDTSFNDGFMKQTFDFCDLTPPSTSPYVDINLGTISPQITFCAPVTGQQTINRSTFRIFPVPATDHLTIETEETNIILLLTDMRGTMVKKGTGTTMSVADVPPGMYFLDIITETGKRSHHKIQVSQH